MSGLDHWFVEMFVEGKEKIVDMKFVSTLFLCFPLIFPFHLVNGFTKFRCLTSHKSFSYYSVLESDIEL